MGSAKTRKARTRTARRRKALGRSGGSGQRGWRPGAALLVWLALFPHPGQAAALAVQTALEPGSCRPNGTAASPALTPALALGLLAFNTPYLFGGRAARTGLTCGACHGTAHPSGAASNLVFRQPVPDLARATARGVDVAAFAGHAVVAEFDGPPATPAVLAALATLAGALAPREAKPGAACLVTPDALVGLDLRLIAHDLPGGDADHLDFLIDSTRFVLGTMAAAQPGAVAQTAILQANRSLRAAEDAVDGGKPAQAAARIATAASAWDAMMAGRHETRFSLAAESSAP